MRADPLEALGVQYGEGPSASDLGSLEEGLRLERDWYKDFSAYPDDESIKTAAGRRELVRCDGADAASLYRPNDRFLNPHPDFDMWQPVLSAQAAEGLNELSSRFAEHEFAESVGRVLLPITSMTRSQAYQSELTSSGKLASEHRSTHLFGGAFDVDLSGYYVEIDDSSGKGVIAVSAGRPFKAIKAAYTRLKEQYPDSPHIVEPIDPASHGLGYRSEISQAAVGILEEMHRRGVINRFREFEGDPQKECMHVAVNPGI